MDIHPVSRVFSVLGAVPCIGGSVQYICSMHWAIPFFIHTGIWKGNSQGVCQKHFL